jgi:hypothetical protein
MRKLIPQAILVGLSVLIFGLGYLCGSISQHRADAQGVGGILEQAGKMGGAVGAVGQLGTSIVEMQEHVTGLQKNLDTLRTIQSALTGK